MAKDEFKDWLGRVKDDSTKAFCQVCKSEISIAHSGIFDLKTHSKGKAHIRNANAVRGSSKITSFAANDKLKRHRDTVTRAETLFCYALAEHNISFNAADHLSQLFPVMFRDSKVAKDFACRRTKSTAIVTRLGPAAIKDVEEVLKKDKGFCSILLDEATDQADAKALLIMVRWYNESKYRAETSFLAMPECPKGDAASIFEHIEKEIEQRGIPWCNVIGQTSDSASTFVGCRNSVFTRLKQKNEHAVLIPCPCHKAHTSSWLCSTTASRQD